MATADKRDSSAELEPPPAPPISAEWKYFVFLVSNVNNVCVVDNKTSVCKLCYVHVAYASRGNTTNIAVGIIKK